MGGRNASRAPAAGRLDYSPRFTVGYAKQGHFSLKNQVAVIRKGINF